jgi:hypothetical protein
MHLLSLCSFSLALNIRQNGWRFMPTAVNAFVSGAMVWIAVRLNLTILNGLTARFSQSGESLQDMVNNRLGGGA